MTFKVEEEVTRMEMLANSPEGLIKFGKGEEYENHVKERFENLERIRRAYTMTDSSMRKLEPRKES